MLAGNGVLRRDASEELRAFARGLHVPVAVTFMGKGAIDDRSHLSLMAVGLQARDHVLSGFDRSDLVISVGYDPVEYAPGRWNPGGSNWIVHIDTTPAEVDAAYRPEVELIGDIGGTLRRLLEALMPRGIGGRDAAARHASREVLVHVDLRQELLRELAAYEADDGWPIRPQKAIADLRAALAPDDIVVSDVGAHKIWVARLYQAYEPNTVIISNGFASMGIALPGAIAASLVHPDRHVVALCGDGGLLMNVQELETAVRLGVRITVVVWRDDGYGLIDWKQRNEFGRPFGVEFGNPDFVALRSRSGWRRSGPRPRPTSRRPSRERWTWRDPHWSRCRSTTARTCGSRSTSGRSRWAEPAVLDRGPQVGQTRGVFIVITGPIASGKSTVARALARELEAMDVRAAVMDLDVVHDQLTRNGSAPDDSAWTLTRREAAAAANAYHENGVAVVIAEGSFNLPFDRATFARDLRPGSNTSLAETVGLSADEQYLRGLSQSDLRLRSRLMGGDPVADQDAYLLDALAAGPTDLLDRMLYADTMTYLPEGLLVKMDRATMAHSLEARAPLLDHKLVEFTGILPAARKMQAGTTKVLLREIAGTLLPPSLLDRPGMGSRRRSRAGSARTSRASTGTSCWRRTRVSAIISTRRWRRGC